MTGIVLTQAALRAGLATIRRMGTEREDDVAATAFFIDALNVLEALLDPAHQPAAPLSVVAAPLPAADPPLEIPPLPEAPEPEPEASYTPAPAPLHLRAKPRGKSGGGRPSSVWCAEREALMRAEFPTCDDTLVLLARVNAVGNGPPVASKDALGQHAIKMGLRRTPQALHAVMLAGSRKGLEQANAARAETLAAVSEPMPNPSPPAPSKPAAPVRSEKEEAFDAFATGMSVRDVQAEFGMSMATAVNWHTEWRLKNRGASA